jgi:AraC family transcriptional regulator
MDWVVRMNNALDYIEAHLADDMDYGMIAKAAFCSAYHFPRMFVAVTGLTLSEYIRRRRLTQAACDLANYHERVIDVAVKYGYESADAFARAFYRQHKVHPSGACKDGVQFTYYPRISFHLDLKGDAPMNYRLEELDSLRIVGRKFEVETKRAFDIVPGIWQREMEGGFLPKLIDMSWEKPKCKLESLLGVIGSKPRISDETFDYFISVRYEGEVPEGMEEWTLPASKWAVFPLVQEAWKRVYTEWLPGSGYDLADAPIVECHYAPGHEPASELWVPVVPISKE